MLFTPNEDFTGAASFDYTISDGQESATTTVTVTVASVAGINRPGTNGRDTIIGGLGRDTLSGGNGDDLINGGSGSDILNGNNGNDMLIGGTGNDTVTGGNGNDVFVLAAGAGTDTMTDFKIGTDVIGLSGGLSFAQLSRSGNTISIGSEVLATLTGVNTATLTQSDFIAV
ncbi:MAG: cadherin-like domain-containing protein [Oscillatoriophycideae cyanobacterium NC_groundwater_1537_Pr4_S-0.65um_50_18]|nr:cadherin-like domain-containing protein [Oscillatoriophycideae cyanobacterium NC_groundwater_1537_Pr4_S-0.65um_50_18]